MSPCRPLPDLCLISVFKQMTPNDQLKAYKMSLRCATLVRAANRHVKTLVISSVEGFYDNKLKSQINSFSLASKPSIQHLPKDSRWESFSDYPMTNTRLSKWNCLLLYCDQLLDPSNIEQIVTTFSAVTDLKYHKCCRISCEILVELLQHSQWADQLTSLVVTGRNWITSADRTLAARLFTSINALSTLQCLAIVWFSELEMSEWSILAQLKLAFLDACDSVVPAFLRSLELYATDNVELQVHLLATDIHSLFRLSESLRSRIIRFGKHLNFTSDNVPLFCQRFPCLTSLSVNIQQPKVEQLFTALSQLPQLIHLELLINWLYVGVNQPSEQQQSLFPRQLAQIDSLRALDLSMTINSHSQLNLLNFNWTMPHLQTLHLKLFYCGNCKFSLANYLHSKDSSVAAEECFGATLLKLHSFVHPDKVILGHKEPYSTLDHLLFTS